MTTRILAEYQAGKGAVDLVGDLYGNFLVYHIELKDLKHRTEPA